jgi:hypothetical protein
MKDLKVWVFTFARRGSADEMIDAVQPNNPDHDKVDGYDVV